MRRKEQDANIQRKMEQKEAHKKRCLKGMDKKSNPNLEPVAMEEDDDAEWYRKEVGEDADEGTFQ